MEVHHHSNTHGNKSWKTYLFEFFMLFLAVFCGFLAEYQLEHTIEHGREIQYVKSFTEDLRKDIHELDSIIRKREERKIWMDSLTILLNTPDPDQFGSQIYFFSRYLPRPFIFFNNGATIQQLKSSGNLRLVRNQAVADTIMAYDQQLYFIQRIRDREEMLIGRIFDSLNELFDSSVFDEMNMYDIEFRRPPGNPHLKKKDRASIERFLGDIHFLKTVNNGQIGWYRNQLNKAKNTLAFLEKEYHLEK